MAALWDPLWSDGFIHVKDSHLYIFFFLQFRSPPSLLPLPLYKMVVSAKCAFRFEHKSCMPLVLYTPPPARDFVFLKRGISNIQCRRSSCRCDRNALSKLQQREGRIFLFFPFDRGLRALLCSNTTPDSPLTPLLLFLNQEQKRRLWLLSAFGQGGEASLHHLLSTIWYGSSAALGAQAAPGSTAGHYRQTLWPKPPNRVTHTQNIPDPKTRLDRSCPATSRGVRACSSLQES